MAAITVKCKSCKKVLKFSADKAGKRTRCPECDELIRIPEADAASEAVQAKKPAAPPPPPVQPPPPAPAPAHAMDDDDEGPKTYGVIAPEATPTMDDLLPQKKKKEKTDTAALGRRIKKRVIHEADKWQKITAVFMLAFVGCCIMGLGWLFTFITYVNGMFFNDARYSLAAEKLLIQKRGTVQQTGNYELAFGQKKAGKAFQVTADGEPDRLTGHYFKSHLQKWTIGKYTVIVRSNDFDPFIRVEDIGGNVLGSDDNSGGGKDALLEVDIPGDGDYNIIVTASIDVPYDMHVNSFLVAIAYGSLEFGRVILILSALAGLAGTGVFMIGYFMCLAVPDVAGTRALAYGLVGMAVVNLMLLLFFKLLPATGAIGYIMLPLVLPELAMTPSNIERLQPLHVYWSYAPFWEAFAAILFSALLHGEIILFCIFLRSVAIALKENYLTENSLPLVQLSFGVLFIYFTFQLVSITGTSAIAMTLMRFIFAVYLGFSIGFTIYLAVVLYKSRALVEKLLEPEEGAEGEEDEDEVDDEEEDDEEEDDRDDDEEDDEDEDDEGYDDDDDDEDED